MEPFSEGGDFTTPVQTSAPKKSRRGLVILLVVLLLALGGYFFYRGYQQNSKNAEVISPTEEPTPTEVLSPTPEATPTASVSSVKNLHVEVLNGTGEEGVAGKMRDHLLSKGYKNIDVGNAENFNYEGVEIRIKEQYKKYLKTIESDVKDAYTISSNSGTLLSDTAKVDVSIIVGK